MCVWVCGCMRECVDLFFTYSVKGEVKLLTKGDNNAVDDRGLYAKGQFWVKKEDVVGRAKG